MKLGRYAQALWQSIDFSGTGIKVTLDGIDPVDTNKFRGTIILHGNHVGKFSASREQLQALAQLGRDATLLKVQAILKPAYAGQERRSESILWDGVERRTRMEA